MITPSYSPTATERVLPRLALDFTTASLDARVTVARALNTATRINSSGLIETVNANLPRFDFTLNTGGACKGLLIEEGRTNALLSSGDVSSAAWLDYTSGSATVSRTGASGTSPDGTNTATLVDVTATGSDQAGVQQAVFFSAATSYSASFYVKAYTANDVGKIIVFRHIGNASYTSATLTADWTRPFSVETNASTGSSTLVIGLRPGVGSSSGNVKFLLWGGQYELGAFPTSYIPTTITSSPRNADVVTMTGTNFSDWYNATEGTLFAQVTGITFGAGTAKGVVSVSSGSYLDSINMYYKADGTTNYGEILASGAAEAVFTLTPQTNKVAIAYKANNANMGYGGLVGTTDTSMTVPSGINQMIIGNVYSTSSSNHPNGCIQKIAYYPQRLTNAELQAITK